MTNKYQDGDKLDYTNSSGSTIAGGALVVISPSLVGVAHDDIPDGETGVLHIKGVFTLTKKSTDTIDYGQPVYWDATPGEITETASAGTRCGVATETKGNGVTEIKVLLNTGTPVAQAATQADSAAADVAGVVADLNALLAKLKAAGIMASA